MNSFVVHPEEGGPHPGGAVLHGRPRQARGAARHGAAPGRGGLLRGAAQPVLPPQRATSAEGAHRGRHGRDVRAAWTRSNAATTAMRHAGACWRFVDALPRGRRHAHRRGRLLHERALRDVGRGGVPRRLRCIASIHGANMVTDQPDSPHRMAPQIRCESYFACAEIDKWAPPADIQALQARCRRPARRTASSGTRARSTASCSRSAPASTTSAAAERHWERLFSLFARRLQRRIS